MNNEEIKEINKHISDALEQWSDILLESDAKDWSYYLNYTDRDLLNALQIFFCVASNIAVKKGSLNYENIEEKNAKLKECIKDTFGFDTVDLAKKVLQNEKDTEQVKYWGSIN